MSSMNCCPYPVEPRGLIITTTYPSDANMFGFHRNDQSSPHAPCGPPWIRNFTGYFFAASNFGGFTMNPCTFFFSAPVNQNGSAGCMEISDKKGALSLLRLVSERCPHNNPRYWWGS